jgi:hypothetical protein
MYTVQAVQYTLRVLSYVLHVCFQRGCSCRLYLKSAKTILESGRGNLREFLQNQTKEPPINLSQKIQIMAGPTGYYCTAHRSGTSSHVSEVALMDTGHWTGPYNSSAVLFMRIYMQDFAIHTAIQLPLPHISLYIYCKFPSILPEAEFMNVRFR